MKSRRAFHTFLFRFRQRAFRTARLCIAPSLPQRTLLPKLFLHSSVQRRWPPLTSKPFYTLISIPVPLLHLALTLSILWDSRISSFLRKRQPLYNRWAVNDKNGTSGDENRKLFRVAQTQDPSKVFGSLMLLAQDYLKLARWSLSRGKPSNYPPSRFNKQDVYHLL